MAKPHPNLLWVEGDEELRVIPQLMEAYVPWGGPKEPDKWPAQIVKFDGVEPLLKPGVIEAGLKSPGLKALGVMIDANADPLSRWRRIQERARGQVPSVPDDLPRDGLVCATAEGLRFGVWIMPDNMSTGMFETFLSLCVVDREAGLWPFVTAHCDAAKATCNAPFRPVHRDKALIHAWLALQDPPGRPLHNALIEKILTPTSPYAAPFVAWFRHLFQV